MSKQRYFKPAPDLSFETVTAQRQAFICLLQDKQTESIHCDLSAVGSCDSAGLALLIDTRRLCLKRRVSLVIDPIPEDIRALARLYGVEKILDGLDHES